MQHQLQDDIMRLTQADEITHTELIQPLWNHYGTLSRVRLRGGVYQSVIVKHIKIPQQRHHPRGFTGSISHQRKVKSYQVEAHWYSRYQRLLPNTTPTPRCLSVLSKGDELCLVLEDLGELGFDRVLNVASWDEMKLVISWLASFHAQFLGITPDGLWPRGTYWHIETRPDELAEIEGTRLHRFASLIDARLRQCRFQTLVHGDAKLANFCFSSDHTSVAGVDFQYIGRGCGMSDLAYFVGSCLSEARCQALEADILEVYFTALRGVSYDEIDIDQLETEWRALYPVAWADFQRFMLGWSPHHRKLTTYSAKMTDYVIVQIRDELLSAAREACLAAGALILSRQAHISSISSKGLTSSAGDVVTEVDIAAQSLILDHLASSISRYDLGVLAEEGAQDESRLSKHAFWAIDPLDGTQAFVEGHEGFAVSIALVSQRGESLIGVVYDPVRQELYQAVKGEGVTINDAPLIPVKSNVERDEPITLFADRSLSAHPHFERYQARCDVRFIGGAVMNTLSLLKEPKSCYIKPPKRDLGGGAIWDFAAVSLMLAEAGGEVYRYDGSPLLMNRPESVYFNETGITFLSADLSYSSLQERLSASS